LSIFAREKVIAAHKAAHGEQLVEVEARRRIWQRGPALLMSTYWRKA